MALRILALIILLNPLASYAQVFGVLGVKVQPCPTRCGIMISQVIPGYPAYQSGLQVGDIIQQFNGVYVYDDVAGVLNYIRNNPRQIVNMTISRQGYMLTGYVILGVASTPDTPDLYPMPPVNVATSSNSYPNTTPPANVTINVFGNVGEQHNETTQVGTGNVSAQNNVKSHAADGPASQLAPSSNMRFLSQGTNTTNSLALDSSHRWLIIASRPTLGEAASLASQYKGNFPYTGVLLSQSGWYAITVGIVEYPAQKYLKDKWISENLIPDDSFFATGTKFTEQVSW